MEEKFEKFCKDHPWLMSESFLKRAFAIWGYSVIPLLFFYAAIFVLAIIASIFS